MKNLLSPMSETSIHFLFALHSVSPAWSAKYNARFFLLAKTEFIGT